MTGQGYFDMGFIAPRERAARWHQFRVRLQQLGQDMRQLHASRTQLAPLPRLTRRLSPQ